MEQDQQDPHTQDLESDTPTEITDEDYWVREEEYHDAFAVYDMMHEIAHSVGVSWNDIGNKAQEQVHAHAMNQPHDEAMEEALWIAGKNCASLRFMPAAHGKEVVLHEVDGNAEFYLSDSRTGVDELVWDEEEEERPSPSEKLAAWKPPRERRFGCKLPFRQKSLGSSPARQQAMLLRRRARRRRPYATSTKPIVRNGNLHLDEAWERR